jgi:hypothetical protein
MFHANLLLHQVEICAFVLKGWINNCTDFTVSNGKMTVNNEMERLWKEAGLFKTLS